MPNGIEKLSDEERFSSLRKLLLNDRKVSREQLEKHGRKLGELFVCDVQSERRPLFFVEFQDEVFLLDKFPIFVDSLEDFMNNKPNNFKEL